MIIWAVASGQFSGQAGGGQGADRADSTSSGRQQQEAQGLGGKETGARTIEPESLAAGIGQRDAGGQCRSHGPQADPRRAARRRPKTKETDVLVVPVRLNLKKGETKPVELTSWDGDSLMDKVSLKDDQSKNCRSAGTGCRQRQRRQDDHERLAQGESRLRSPIRQNEVPATDCPLPPSMPTDPRSTMRSIRAT